MALYWDWKEKVGEAVIQQGENVFKVNLYEGNAFLIFIYEWHDDGEGIDKYQLWSFFADEQHAKNCFGLNKKNNYGGIFDDDNKLVKVRINKTKYRYTKKLVDMLVRAFDEIQIEIYSAEEKKDED